MQTSGARDSRMDSGACLVSMLPDDITMVALSSNYRLFFVNIAVSTMAYHSIDGDDANYWAQLRSSTAASQLLAFFLAVSVDFQ